MALFRERCLTWKALWTDGASCPTVPDDADPSRRVVPLAEKSLFRLTAELKNLLHRDRLLRTKNAKQVLAEKAAPERRQDEEAIPEGKNAVGTSWKDRATEFLPISPERKNANRLSAASKKGHTNGEPIQ